MKPKPKNPFKNKNKSDKPVDQTRERLKSILGVGISQEFVEWYRQDVGSKGFTTPFMKYQGPGNATNIGEPANEADRFALKHDLQYAHASYKLHKGMITQEQFQNRIKKIDEEFLKNNAMNVTSSMNPGEQIASTIGTVGIGIKYAAERVIGQQYPSTDPTTTYTGIKKETNTNLTNKLMKILKGNVSKSSNVDQGSSSMEVDKTPVKRPGEPAEGDTPTKKGTATAATPAADPNLPEDMATLTGTGEEQASGGASSEGLVVHYIEKPISIFGHKTTTYKKSHKFMTFGLAPNIIPTTTIEQANFALTSYLAEIPWHIPALYLNPSEFKLIPDGSKIVEVSVEVIYRGSTIQFETNASSTGLATLNQINDIAVAHGLNRTGWGSNIRYSAFNATQPMIPTDCILPTYGPVPGTYRGMVRDYYGSDNTAADFTSDIPKHQVGRQTFLYNYWVNTARGPTTTAGNVQFGGWPCLAGKITQMDGKTVVNQVVASSTYKPKFAPIKPPLRMQGHGLPFPNQNGSYTVPGVGNMVNARNATINILNVTPSNEGIQIGATEATSIMTNVSTQLPNFEIYTPIEKSQFGRSGFWDLPEPHIQPSLHVGVQPVPALSTSATLLEDAQFNNWTDTRAYWEVVATMVVDEHTPTEWPLASTANVPAGETVQWLPLANRPVVNIDPRNDGATFAGLYTTSVLPIS